MISDKRTHKEGYGIAPDERIGVLGIGMGSNYGKYKEQVKQILKELEILIRNRFLCVCNRDAWTSELCGSFFIIWK